MAKPLDLKSNWVDSAVSYFSPVHGAQRLKARAFMSVASHHAASLSRRPMSGWKTLTGDADADTVADIPKLRERSRDLIRNAPLANGALNTATTAVVGGTGLVKQSVIDAKVLGITEQQAMEWELNADREFSIWANSQECDVERTLRFPELQALAFRQVFENGDLFISMPHFQRPGSSYGLKLQFIEADRVLNPLGARDDASFAGGVKKDKTGAPVSYYVSKIHPGALIRPDVDKFDVLPAFGPKTGRRTVLHLFDKLRPGQSRGVPMLSTVMESLKQLDRYREAELMAAVVAGMYTVFVKTESGEQDFAPFQPDSETGGKTTDEDMKLANGAIISLAENESIDTANPQRPNANYDPFVTAILKEVGASLGMPYEILMKNFQSSYSASRAAMLEAWRFFNARRVWLARSFCQPVYEAWLMEAVASGRIIAPGFLNGDESIRQAYCACNWVGPARGMIDENKEIDAADKRVAMGISTLQRESAELTGTNYIENHKQHKRELEMRRADGFDSEPAQPSDSAANQLQEVQDQVQQNETA